MIRIVRRPGAKGDNVELCFNCGEDDRNAEYLSFAISDPIEPEPASHTSIDEQPGAIHFAYCGRCARSITRAVIDTMKLKNPGYVLTGRERRHMPIYEANKTPEAADILLVARD